MSKNVEQKRKIRSCSPSCSGCNYSNNNCMSQTQRLGLKPCLSRTAGYGPGWVCFSLRVSRTQTEICGPSCTLIGRYPIQISCISIIRRTFSTPIRQYPNLCAPFFFLLTHPVTIPICATREENIRKHKQLKLFRA